MGAVTFPDPRLPVFGLPFFATDAPDLRRLPLARKDSYRSPVWGLAQSPAGGRIRFASDTTRLSIKLDYGNVGHMNNMCRIGQHAVDCYVDGVFWRNAAPLEGEPLVETTLFAGVAKQMRQIDLYLPLYHGVKVLELGFDDAASIAAPAPFAKDLPVVYYGSSITQGGCASRSGNSYQAIVSRRLNLDHVNLGFSGNGLGEPEVADTMAGIPACCYVVDYSQNCPTVEQMRETYAPFLATLRERNSETPMLCVTPIRSAGEAWDAKHHGSLEGKRQVVRDAVAARIAAGDNRIQVVEGPDLLGPDQVDGIVDSSHPNDLGFWHMANGLQRPLAGALGL